MGHVTKQLPQVVTSWTGQLYENVYNLDIALTVSMHAWAIIKIIKL